VKISDFGLARLQAPDAEAGPGEQMGTILAKENTVMGTPDFLSPEQARNLHEVDIRADLYSLGCTFYYLLTGQVPFPGGTSLEKLIRQGTEPHPPVAGLRPEVPAGVAAVVDRLLEKRPEDRYQTPAELAAALEPFAAGGPVPWAPPPSTPYLDTLATPAGGPTAGSTPADVERVATDELAALAPADATPTTGTRRRRPGGWRKLPAKWDRRVVAALAVGVAAGVAVAALGGVAVALLLSGR
jgi:serine/threonine-protein kinase